MPLYAIHTIRKEGIPDEEYIKARFPRYRIWQFDNEDAGRLLGSGPLSDPVPGSPWKEGFIVVRCENEVEARALADTDPYHVAGYREYRLLRWTINESSILGVGLRAHLNGDEPSNPFYRRPKFPEALM